MRPNPTYQRFYKKRTRIAQRLRRGVRREHYEASFGEIRDLRLHAVERGAAVLPGAAMQCHGFAAPDNPNRAITKRVPCSMTASFPRRRPLNSAALLRSSHPSRGRARSELATRPHCVTSDPLPNMHNCRIERPWLRMSKAVGSGAANDNDMCSSTSEPIAMRTSSARFRHRHGYTGARRDPSPSQPPAIVNERV